jgi:ssDNA-binding Zn-finger/Zn-ribbon topoisomerase 1
MHYDEEVALNNYILQHYGHLMTQLESRFIKAIQAEEKAKNSEDDRLRSLIRRRWGRFDDAEVAQALEAGAGPFICGVRERLFREKGEFIVINRCPECDRIVRTPSARQCFWCGNDWH